MPLGAIVRNGASGGEVSLTTSAELVPTKSELEDTVICLLSGRAAEEIILQGPPSSGAGGDESSDLAKATTLVARWHCNFGMGQALVWRGPMDATLTMLTMDSTLRKAVNEDLAALYARALAMMKEHAAMPEAVVAQLLAKRTLQGSEVRAAMKSTVKVTGHVPDLGEPLPPEGLSLSS